MALRERVADRYVVEKELATGGMGIVYHVLDRTTGEARALKRLTADAAKEPVLVEAFEREYQVLAGLDHPRIIRVFDYGVDEIGPYYTMELLEGQDMRKSAPLPPREACMYLRDVATSLSLLHARRLIHRDLSPTNVRLTPDGHCKLLDFGALTAFGNSRLVVGTAPLIPPEALEGGALDQRADLYSLGALAYWMLTRRHAYPAKRIEDLEELWKESPLSPSDLVPEVPEELSDLVLSLLSADPLARPASAAEVIARLNVVGELKQEGEAEAERLAQSFLLSPRFTGRLAELAELKAHTEAAFRGSGSAVRIEAMAGMGRSRFLEEIGVRSQIAGASVLRVDASMYRQVNGTTRALVIRMLDTLPDLARETGRRYRAGLAALGREVDARLSSGLSLPPGIDVGRPSTAEPIAPVEAWFAEISRSKPLVIQVDNVEYADPSSLGLLAALAKLSASHSMLLIVTERLRRDQEPPMGLLTLRNLCKTIPLAGLSADETLELVQSLFGDVPRSERFAEWIHGRTAGSPLHAIEISRQLVGKQVIRHFGGIWALPVDRPDADLPAALEDALLIRLGSLSEAAQGLAECLSLQREQPTFELCRMLSDKEDDRLVHTILDELARNDVLYPDQQGYRFSSTALREALLGGMEDARREQNHRRLGEAFAELANPTDHALRIEAGWHLIKGGEELRGADMIASVTCDSVVVRTLIANLHHAARPIEAALKIYKRHRLSSYERMPLLAALAHAGYYEERSWGDQYGDDALDALEDLSGLRMAGRLRGVLGQWLSLILGIAFAFVRFQLAPRRQRGYPFREVLIQLFGAVTTITGAAALSLDVERAARVADVLEPFSCLPERLTPVGIYQYCVSLQEIGREHQATAYQSFERIMRRLEDARYYPTLPAEARRLYWTAAHYARGSFAVFRADGRAALESADALDLSGLKLYAMIASQLRFLYYANRGEFSKAAPHREQVELHAAHVGSAWQVETWEPTALLSVQASLGDVVAITRTVDRLKFLSKTVPSLKLYFWLAKQSLRIAQREKPDPTMIADLAARPPRSFIGWALSHGFLARSHNQAGEHQEAKRICEGVLAHVTEEDRDYVSLFLVVDIEMALAEGALGDSDGAFRRIDALLARFRDVDHPLVQGSLYEARARIAWASGRPDEYALSLAAVESWFRPTGTPGLIARYERLLELSSGPSESRRRGHGAMSSSTASVRGDGKLVSATPERQDEQTVRVSTRRIDSA